MATPQRRPVWVIVGINLAALLLLGCLPLARCPSCSSGWCRVEAYVNGEKIPCDLCGDRGRISPIAKVWMNVRQGIP